MPYEEWAFLYSFEKFHPALKRKKIYTFVYPGLRYGHKKLNFACEKIFLGQF